MMDWLLLCLQLLFFVPVIWRIASRSGGAAKTELRQPLRGLREPGILVHCIGGVLLFGATVLGLVQDRLERAPSLHGVIGAVVIAAGAVLLVWSLSTLRSWRFLPEIAPGHELCTSGPYAMVRHPNYLALDLLGLGSLIWLPTLPMASAALLLAIGGDWRARVEERALLRAFGDRYRDYMKRVRRTIPWVY
jgi:protein-S-isoprenylcysteine O-methyltransferase Ste14